MAQDPKHAGPKPPQPKQQQAPPGQSAEMTPKPDHGEELLLRLWQARRPRRDRSAPSCSMIADPFNGRIDAFRIAHVQRSDGWIETTWNIMSDPGAFAAVGAEEQEGGEPPPLAGAGVVVCLMG